MYFDNPILEKPLDRLPSPMYLTPMLTTNHSFPLPRPRQGVGEFGRPRRTWNAEIAGSNPAALTNHQPY